MSSDHDMFDDEPSVPVPQKMRGRARDDRLDAEPDRPIMTSRGVLTAAEIEALLRPDLPDAPYREPDPSAIKPRLPEQFGSTGSSPEIMVRRQIAGSLASRLSLSFGKHVGLKAAIGLVDIETLKSAGLPGLLTGKVGAVACFGHDELDIQVMLCLPQALVDAIIAKACGSAKSTGRPLSHWSLSAIDHALLEQLLSPLSPVFGEGLALQAIETDVPFVCSLMVADDIGVADYKAELPGLKSELAVIASANFWTGPKLQGVEPTQKPAPVTAVLTARLARLTVPLSRIRELKPGSTLLLGLPADQPVEVLSGGRDGEVVFEGSMGRRGKKIAVRIDRKTRALKDL